MPALRDLRYEFIRTPLEQPLIRLRELFARVEQRRHPELAEVHREDARIRSILARVLDADSCCVDAGCHYGSILSRFCRLAPRGRHVAFEAIPKKARFLRRKFPDVDVREGALAEAPGRVKFFLNRTATGYSGLARHGQGEFEELEVACWRLDDVVPRDRRFDFVKLDVEGAELMVLRGAREFLGRDRPTVLFECTPSGPPMFGYAPGEIHALFESLGYGVFRLRDVAPSGRPVGRADFERALVYPFQAFNWLAIPDERAAEVTSRRRP